MRSALLGSKQLCLDALAVLRVRSEVSAILTIDDRADERSRFEDLVAAGAHVAESRRDADAAIMALDADVVVVVGWYWIIRAEELARRRFLGIHHSLLPRYRGGAPLVWALLEGQPTVGTTLFELAKGADEGQIWGQTAVDAGEGYIGDVSARCDAAAVRLLTCIFDPTTVPSPQDHAQATRRPQRHERDGLIDWSRPAVELQRWVRAQSRPYPGAFTYDGARKVRIWRATATNQPAAGPPGLLRGSIVTCGDGFGLRIEDADERVSDGSQFTQSSAGRMS